MSTSFAPPIARTPCPTRNTGPPWLNATGKVEASSNTCGLQGELLQRELGALTGPRLPVAVVR
jgi:hypothetical protein